MNPIIIFILGIIAGLAIAQFLPKKQTKIGKKVQEQISAKEERKRKIIVHLRKHGAQSNNDIEKLLKVSDATVTNYLQELEDQGKVEQIGEKGRFVKYQLK